MVNSFYPTSYIEVLDILDRNEVIIFAGGTDLMVKRKNWSNLPAKFDKDVMFLAGLKELNYIKKEGNRITIGATTTLQEVLLDKNTPRLLVEALKVIASPAIRHMGTLAGNIVNASPAGDTLPVLYLLNAVIVAESKTSIRKIPIEEFITGPSKTSLKENEMVKEIILTDCEFTKSVYKKIGSRKANTISKICFCAGIKIEDSEITDIRVSFGAVAPRVVRKREIETRYIGKVLKELKESEEVLVEEYSKYIVPIDDQRSNKKYRKKVALNLLKNFIEKV